MNRLAYALYKGLQSFNQGLEEYENKKEILDKNFLLKEISITLNQAILKYNISFDTILDSIFPKEYQPILRVVKNMRIDQLIDIVSEITKEYAKDEDGKYKSLDETLVRVTGKTFLRKIFGGKNG
ncbi:MAG: hypothetical protein QW140_02875 [Candidatus Aenigmatarchaeota archaeon]